MHELAERAEDGNFFKGKRIIVTGAAGTIGSELIRHLLRNEAAEVRGIDSHENGLFAISEALRQESRFHPFICDVRNSDKLEQMFKNMDYCIHTAALKHVGSSERAPFETVQTNIMGVQNVIQGALGAGVQRVLLTSSDKAVNPTNVMGTTKLMGERLITAANAVLAPDTKAVFASVRFGNVIGSTGSVVPLFCEQIARGGPITLTDDRMTRFVMSLDDAVQLVLRSLRIAQGGEVFVTRMSVVRIIDVARELIHLVAPLFHHDPDEIEICRVGPRPGEKLYEELTTDEELRRTLVLDDFYAVLPAFRNIYDGINYTYPNSSPATSAHNSANETPLSKESVRRFLLRPGVLPGFVEALIARKERVERPAAAVTPRRARPYDALTPIPVANIA